MMPGSEEVTTVEFWMEFVLAIDLDKAFLRFGCNNKMFDYVLPIARYQWYTVNSTIARLVIL